MPQWTLRRTLSQTSVDYICVGEGEEAILELIEKGSPQGVKNIGYKNKRRVLSWNP